MSNRTSKRRTSLSSFTFSRRQRKKSAASRTAENASESRDANREVERMNTARRERDNATIRIYDDKASQTINDAEFLRLSSSEQRLLIYKEARANKLVAIKLRRVQHKQLSEESVEQLEITDMMRADMEKFVCDWFFGLIPKSDAQKNFTTFPMSFWKLIRKALFDYYFKQSRPIAQAWAKDSEAAEEEAKAAFKRIRARFYGLLESWVNGKNGGNSIAKICQKINLLIQKETKIDGEDSYSRLRIYTRFESLLVEQCSIETDMIRVASEYGTDDTSGAMCFLGDFVQNYMIFKKFHGWKDTCKQCIRDIEVFFKKMREESRRITLPSTELEFTQPPSQSDSNLSLSLENWLEDEVDVDMGNGRTNTPSRDHGAVSSVEKPTTIFISDDESEDLLPSEIFNRKLASDLSSKKKSKSQENKKSIYRGVTYCNRTQKWIGKVWRSTKWSTVGYFSNDVEAARAINRKCRMLRLPKQNQILEDKDVEEPAAVGNIAASTKRKREKILEETPKPKISDFPPKKKRRLSIDLFSLPLSPPPLETLTPEKM